MSHGKRRSTRRVVNPPRQSYEKAAAAEMDERTQQASWCEMEPLLDETLAELPAQMRTIIIERFLEGRTQQELAARLGVSQPTVSRQVEVALHELRSRLQAKGVLCGAGLAVLLGSHSARAAPPGVAASLGKVSISGLGTKAAITPGAGITTALIAVTTTAKPVLATTAIAIVSIPFVIPRSPPSVPKHTPAQANAQPVSSRKSAGKTADTGASRPHYRPSPVTAQTRQTVEGIIRRHQGMSKAELQKSAELNKLMDRFIAMMNTPEMQAKLEQRIAALQRMPGAEQGMVMMDFGLLEDTRGRAWLEAAVSNEPQRIEEWILNTLDDAIFEFAFDPGLERTSNGVSVQPSHHQGRRCRQTHLRMTESQGCFSPPPQQDEDELKTPGRRSRDSIAFWLAVGTGIPCVVARRAVSAPSRSDRCLVDRVSLGRLTQTPDIAS